MVECPYSKQIWSAAATWAGCPSLSPAIWSANFDLQSWFCHLLKVQQQYRKGVGSLVLLIVWSLWRERNNRIFRKAELSVPRFISFLRDAIRMWIFAGAKFLSSLVGHIFCE
ncbi:hypothetical protein PAHAL_3G041000 [Panicum hallii]|uniref:Uncharacterized protein n=1 Tax=Panicum hallii TaxID=206008 RepID=A0A2T8KH65_9POAL|nr:hypothetical protein PAHAL_3G041000 [Panicum hallii]